MCCLCCHPVVTPFYPLCSAVLLIGLIVNFLLTYFQHVGMSACWANINMNSECSTSLNVTDTLANMANMLDNMLVCLLLWGRYIQHVTPTFPAKTHPWIQTKYCQSRKDVPHRCGKKQSWASRGTPTGSPSNPFYTVVQRSKAASPWPSIQCIDVKLPLIYCLKSATILMNSYHRTFAMTAEFSFNKYSPRILCISYNLLKYSCNILFEIWI